MRRTQELDIEDLAVELAELLQDEGLAELTFEDEVHKLRMRRRQIVKRAIAGAAGSVEEVSVEEASYLTGTPVTSSVVGLYHQADSIAGDPLVRVGDRIHQGQVLCFIESMSLNHEVRAPLDGVVLEVLAREGEPVEYGQALMLVDSH